MADREPRILTLEEARQAIECLRVVLKIFSQCGAPRTQEEIRKDINAELDRLLTVVAEAEKKLQTDRP